MKNSKRISVLVLIGLLFLALSATGFAQNTATISGSVRDQSGAVLPGVDVTATQTDTGISRAAVTNETGSYVLTNLPVGPYRVEAGLPGFRTYVQTGIVLQVNDAPVINAVLEVGQVSETVEVQANAALVETRNTTVSQVIDNQRVVELPLNGRQATELILLSGVANVGGVNANNSGIRNYPTTTISVAGGMGNGLVYLLDGGTHNDVYNNLGLPMPFPDALQEFKVETSGMQAQYGQHSSGVMNAVTKSGTNEFHGDLFWFLRNGELNARNTFALKNDGLKRNQFGGTLGGPIVRNKVFFFGGHQTTTERAAPSTARQFIPSAKMLAGDFTDFAAPACNGGRQLTLAAPYVNNRISPSAFSPAAVTLVTWNKDGLVFPRTDHPCGEIQFGRRSENDEHLSVGKIDYQVSDKQSFFGRYLEARRTVPNDLDRSNYLTLSIGDLTQDVYSLVLGQTYLIGSGTVSSFRATALRTKIERINPQVLTLSDIGVKNIFNPYKGFMRLTITNGFNWAVNIQPGHYSGYGFQFAEDLSIVKGDHQIGLGANYIRSNLNANSGVSTNPTFNFTGTGTGHTGHGLTDFLIGKANTLTQGNETVGNGRQHYIGLYLQDTWKTTPKLTLNYGLRWEPSLPGWEAHGQTAHFNRAKFDAGVRSQVYINAPVGLEFPPLRGDDAEVSADGRSRKYHNNRWLQFAPRFGFALDPSGDGRTTIRAATGVYFDYAHLWTYSAQGNNAPFGNLVSNAEPSFDDPWGSLGLPNPFPLYPNTNSTFAANGSYNSYRDEAAAPYVYQWNLNVQRQLGQDWLVSATYLGNSIIHLLGDTEHNPAIFFPGAPVNGVCVADGYDPATGTTRSFTLRTTGAACSTTGNISARRLLTLLNPIEGPKYGYVQDVTDDGTSNYHGGLLSIQRRNARGLTVQGNYTWSHCIGDPGDSQPGIGTSAQYPGKRYLERGDCSGDRRQVVNLSTVYQTPQFANRTARLLASNWQISGIIRLQTGETFTVSSGADTCLCAAQANNRADQVLADPYAPEKNIDQWINKAAFARPALGNFGNAGVNYRGPGAISINMGLTRKFQVRETQTVEFRAEAFNLPNHVNPNNPDASITSVDFGRITAAGDPRIMQLALKYVF